MQENLWTWMMDKRGRDQFVVRYGDETEVYWNDAQRAQAEDVYKRSFWTDSFVLWSPHGSCLATVHRQGVALWGGPSFSRLHRFSHQNVRTSPSLFVDLSVSSYFDWPALQPLSSLPSNRMLFLCDPSMTGQAYEATSRGGSA
jgi:hypothetical protein